MRAALVFGAAILALTDQAHAWTHGGGLSWLDGYAAAPIGTPQHPTLLSAYGVRPPWHVAGVDYRVGVPSSVTLKDPATLPTSGTGFLYSAAGKQVSCAGSVDGAVLDGYDLSLHGGLIVYINGCTRTTIKNSNFGFSTNCSQLINNTGGTGITLLYDTFDGGLGSTNCNAATQTGEMVYLLGGGAIVVRYNWFKNAYQHFASFGVVSGSGNTIDERFNLFERCGFAQGVHCNGFQISAGPFDGTVVAFNTYWSPQPDTNLTADLQTSPTGTFTSGSNVISNLPTHGNPGSIIVAAGGYANSLHRGETIINAACLPVGTTITNDPTVFGATAGYDATATLTLSNNATCATGSYSFDVVAYPSGITIPVHYDAQLGSSSQPAALTNGAITNNVMVQSGPVKTVAYSLEADAAGGAYNTCSSMTFLQNYVDQTGQLSPTFQVACGAVTRIGNVDLSTGSAIP